MRWRDQLQLIMLDMCATALALGYAIGRIGCQVSGDGDYGIRSSPAVGDGLSRTAPSPPRRGSPCSRPRSTRPSRWASSPTCCGACATACAPGSCSRCTACSAASSALLVEFIRRNKEVLIGLTAPQLESVVLMIVGAVWLALMMRGARPRGPAGRSALRVGADRMALARRRPDVSMSATHLSVRFGSCACSMRRPPELASADRASRSRDGLTSDFVKPRGAHAIIQGDGDADDNRHRGEPRAGLPARQPPQRARAPGGRGLRHDGARARVRHPGVCRRRGRPARACAGVRRQAGRERAGHEELHVVFASKAFPCTAVLRTLAQEGLWCDVASGGELHLALTRRLRPRSGWCCTATPSPRPSCAWRCATGWG